MNPEKLYAALVVFRKEFREIFRDRRTMFNVVISPLLITPMIFALVGNMASKQAKDAEKEKVAVAIIGSAKAPALMAAIKGAENMDFTEAARPDAEENIRNHKIKAAVVIPEDAEQRMKENRTVRLSLLVDQGSDTSVQAARRLESLFLERGQRVVAQRLIEQGLSSELATPFQTTQTPVPGGGSLAMLILAGFLPYILAISAIMGGISAANDSVAGEKERGTLETLLVSPVSRLQLVLGKFLAVAGVSLVSSLLSVVGILWPFYVPIKAFHWLAEGGLTLTPLAIGMIVLVQVPLAVLGAGVLMAISTFSRNQKEAQTYLGPVLTLAIVASMMSLFLKADTNMAYALVPILNAALVLKQALQGTVNGSFAALASVASFAYAGVALYFCVTLFQKEEVLLKA